MGKITITCGFGSMSGLDFQDDIVKKGAHLLSGGHWGDVKEVRKNGKISLCTVQGGPSGRGHHFVGIKLRILTQCCIISLSTKCSPRPGGPPCSSIASLILDSLGSLAGPARLLDHLAGKSVEDKIKLNSSRRVGGAASMSR